MRVISQRGNYDFPYEHIVVRHEMEYVMAVYKEKEYVLGKYSSDDKAVKAMEMLRETYTGMPIVMQNVDVSEDMAEKFERLKKCGIMVRAENQPPKVECVNNAIFQFPQDEDVEINNGLE